MDHQGQRLEDLGAVINPSQFKRSQVFLRAAKEAVGAGTLSCDRAFEEEPDGYVNWMMREVEFPNLLYPMLFYFT